MERSSFSTRSLVQATYPLLLAMSNPPRPMAQGINSVQPRQQSQRAGPPPQPTELTLEVGPNTTENDILNAMVAHIFNAEVQREAQQASASRPPNSAVPSSSKGVRPSSPRSVMPKALARLVRPFNRSSTLRESPQQASPSLDEERENPRGFIDDVRNALPKDIDSRIVDSLGQDALRIFSRDNFPYDLASFLQRQEAVPTENLYPALIDLLSAKARSYAFSEMPVRVIKLPENVFLERDGVAEYLVKKLKRQPTQVFAEISVEDIRDCLYNNPSFLHLCQSIAERWLKKEARFVILSHTWEGDELTYKDFLDSEQRTRRSQSYDKLRHFCTIAHEEFDAGYAWADTVCIDKSSSAELDESIRSMFEWYRKSHACLVYLSRSLSLQDLAGDRWFTRGWTLQELLAPRCIKFYNRNWQPLTRLPNDKKALGRRPEAPIPRSYTELAQTILHTINNDTSHLIDADLDATARDEIAQLEAAIVKATGIPMNDIIDFRPGFTTDLSKRMRWIARRNTTRAEDKSYCMMGIFGVSMSIAYGEGPERASFRLFETILKVSSSPDLFLWAGKPVQRNIHVSSMIPSSPECFMCADLGYPADDFRWETQRSLLLPREPITLTNVGTCMTLLTIPEVEVYRYDDPGHASPKRMRLATALSDDLVDVTLLTDEWLSFGVRGDGSRVLQGEVAFGVCNVVARAEGSRPRVPRRVWAVVMYRRDGREGWRRLSTQGVVVFECAERFRGREVEMGGMGSWRLLGMPEMFLQTLYL